MSVIGVGLAVLIVFIFILAILLLTPRIRRGQILRLRPLPGYAAAREAIGRGAEQGRTTHLAAGPGGIADSASGTAGTLAGLQLMGRMAMRAAQSGAPPLATTGDALALPLAENMVRGAYGRAGRADETPGLATGPAGGGAQGVRMLAHRDPMAYAAACADLSENEGIGGAALVGSWGPEYLLVNEAQARAGVHSVAGATSAAGLAGMALGANHTLIGEEIYTAGAYLDAEPAHLASLLAQDTVRLLLIALILIGAVLASVGVNIETLFGVSR
jgi:hypothetical protein